jgi:hypothetical protein
MAKLGRDDLKQAPDTEESRKELAELVKRTPPLSSPPNILPLSDINVARQVFQWRPSSYGAAQKLEFAHAGKATRRARLLEVSRKPQGRPQVRSALVADKPQAIGTRWLDGRLEKGC